MSEKRPSLDSRSCFLQAIAKKPTDETLQLSFADWLEEQGDVLGEIIKLDFELRNPWVQRLVFRMPLIDLHRKPEKERFALRQDELIDKYDKEWLLRFQKEKLKLQEEIAERILESDPDSEIGEWRISSFSGKLEYAPDDPSWLLRLTNCKDNNKGFLRNVRTATLNSDAALKFVPRLHGLETLWLRGPDVTDTGLESVAGSSNLSSLSLTKTQITDQGFRHLRGLASLTSLSLDRCPRVKDEGLVHLSSIPKLQSLMLNETSISDLGFKHLRSLPRLRRLMVKSSAITDIGLAHLEMHSALSRVELNGTRVSATGAEKFRRSNRCNVSLDEEWH